MSDTRPSKRRRIYRACDQCRRRKSKCDGEQPVCSICRQANRTCTYETGGGRRGLPSGYVRSLEIALGLLFQNTPNSESTLHNALRDLRSKSNFLTNKHAKRSVSIWQKSKPYRDVSQLLSPDSDVVLEESDWEPADARSLDEVADHQDAALANPEPQKVEIPLEVSTHDVGEQSVTSGPFPDNTTELIDFYFTHTHCWFPILERRSILRTMHLGNGNLHSPSQNSSSIIALWSLIAYSSIIQGSPCRGTPNYLSLQLAIEEQGLAHWETLDLGHVQAMLILVLVHITLGNFNQAWSLVGKATRVLVSLPFSARNARFTHTFNGSVLLDNILSTLLDQTPCLSQNDQIKCGPVEEDDLEEWDVWSSSRPGTDAERRAPASPLRALSSFNHIQKLMQQLSRLLYTSSDPSEAGNILDSLQREQSIISRTHSCEPHMHAPPSILNLHLVSAFTTLAVCRSISQVSSSIRDLLTRTIYHILDLLDHYNDVIGAANTSSLTICFAVQCQRSLDLSDIPEIQTIQNRISSFLQPFKSVSFSDGNNPVSDPASHFFTQQGDQSHEAPVNPMPVTSVADMPDSTALPLLQPQSEPSSIINIPIASSSTNLPLPQSPSGTGDTDMHDALFEDILTFFPPSRYLLKRLWAVYIANSKKARACIRAQSGFLRWRFRRRFPSPFATTTVDMIITLGNT